MKAIWVIIVNILFLSLIYAGKSNFMHAAILMSEEML